MKRLPWTLAFAGATKGSLSRRGLDDRRGGGEDFARVA
jgi:hypothetical protein